MVFCRFGNDYIKEGYTQIDNNFILRYLPSFDGTDVKVYLYGLTMAATATEENNTAEKIAVALKLSEDRVMLSFRRWEEQGLVTISSTLPFQVTYHSVKQPLPKVIKHDVKKYENFIDEVNRLFPDKILSPSEQNELVNLLHFSKLEENALLMIMRYCIDIKGGAVSTPYILAVANDWINKGMLTLEKISEHIELLESNSEDIRKIFASIGSKATPCLEDRQLYQKWREMGYTLDAVLCASKAQKKKGGIERLDKYIEELYAFHAVKTAEILAYKKMKDEKTELTVRIIKNLGAYYASIEIVIDTYVSPWLDSGFSDEALLRISKFCFLRSVRTLEGMGQMVEKFYKLGLLSADSIDTYVKKQMAIDLRIKEIFELCGQAGVIGNRDREYYRNWVEVWSFSDELIDFIAKVSATKSFPVTNMNRILGELKQRNINTVDGARVYLDGGNGDPKTGFLQQEYTEEQLKSVLTNFEDWKV